ncbi:MAG: hypothetical protein ACI910_000790 [Oleispira sp.]
MFAALGIMKTTICAILLATLIQLPLGYFFTSVEGLVLGHGFIGTPSGIWLYLASVLLVSTILILFIGLPIYFVLKHFKLNTTINVAVVGFVIPALILCALNFGITNYEGYSAGENYYGTYRSTFVGGSRTIWGWVTLIEELVTYGIHGIIGATIFHKIYAKGRKA